MHPAPGTGPASRGGWQLFARLIAWAMRNNH
jgi:hypothetical protein